MPFDVSNRDESRNALLSWQQAHADEYIEVLVNNAGIRQDGLLVLMDSTAFERVIATNLLSFYNVTQPLLEQMIWHHYGRIINIASLSGITGQAGQCNFSAAKGGLIAATKALAHEIAKKNITVNAVAPGFIRTDMVAGLDENGLKEKIPMRRFGEPEEVAELVAFLASRNASYITGECITISGGV